PPATYTQAYVPPATYTQTHTLPETDTQVPTSPTAGNPYQAGAATQFEEPGNEADFSSLSNVVARLNQDEALARDLIDTRPPLLPRESAWGAGEGRDYGNRQAARYRREVDMDGGPTIQAGHSAAARHVAESNISEDDWDRQRMQQLHSRLGQGFDVSVTDQHDDTRTRTRHTAQEGLIDQAVEQVRDVQGTLTPQGQLDAGDQVVLGTSNVPLDQRAIDWILRSGRTSSPDLSGMPPTQPNAEIENTLRDEISRSNMKQQRQGDERLSELPLPGPESTWRNDERSLPEAWEGGAGAPYSEVLDHLDDEQ
ncbi:hypothetical protein, partial [Actinomycetospora straminea]